jgi:hypothetical protein
MKKKIINKWDKETRELRFNAPIENIPRLIKRHRTLSRKI